ncbi:MAG: UDP-GlcNAc:undecaprenyl-phosphate GlcNAc-1-phosphate transferase [Alteromonas naphthalenivorans]
MGAFLVSLVSVVYITPLLRVIAFRNKIVDSPDGKIKRQKEPVPYLGGVAIFLGFLVSFFLFLPIQNYLLFFILGLAILLTLGLIDDLWVTTPFQKLLGQMIAAASFLIAGFSLKENFLSSSGNAFLSFFWILSIVNAFNLVDVMDGLATLLALCATATFLIFGLLFNLPVVTILLSAFLGSLGGFFYYNKPPAKIYLGDAGALFVGGFLAVIPFFFNWGFHSFTGFLVPCIVLAIPLLEGVALIAIRTYKRKPFYYGSPDHYCLYLIAKGWTKKEVLLFSGLISCALLAFGYFVAFGLLSLGQTLAISVAGFIFLLICVYSPFVSRKATPKNVAFYKLSVAKGKEPLV